MAPLATLADVERVLGELGARGYAARLDRRPGQKEDRFMQLLGGGTVAEASDAEEPPALSAIAPAPTPAPASAELDELRERVGALEADVAALRAQLADLLT